MLGAVLGQSTGKDREEPMATEPFHWPAGNAEDARVEAIGTVQHLQQMLVEAADRKMSLEEHYRMDVQLQHKLVYVERLLTAAKNGIYLGK
jgi:hypothetical protein